MCGMFRLYLAGIIEVPKEAKVKTPVDRIRCRSAIGWLAALALLSVVPASGVTLTLSQRGIMALDYRAPASSASVLKAVRSGGGVEYTVLFRARTASLHLASLEGHGAGLLAGLPLNPGDSFALRFTLLSDPLGPKASVGAGASINGPYQPVQLGAGRPRVAISNTPVNGPTAKTIGFTLYIAPALADAWPESGGIVRVLVEPAPLAIPLEPRGEPAPLPDAPPGRTLTLTQQELLHLRSIHAAGASIMSAVPSGNGVEYTVQFDNSGGSLALEVNPTGADAALLGIPLSGADSFALRFTLLDVAPQSRSIVSTASTINFGPDQHMADRPLKLGTITLKAGTSDTGTDATMTRGIGLRVFIAPSEAASWPETGGSVRILVEPAVGATPIAAARP